MVYIEGGIPLKTIDLELSLSGPLQKGKYYDGGQSYIILTAKGCIEGLKIQRTFTSESLLG